MKAKYVRRDAVREAREILEEIAEDDRALNEVLRSALRGSMHPREALARDLEEAAASC